VLLTRIRLVIAYDPAAFVDVLSGGEGVTQVPKTVMWTAELVPTMVVLLPWVPILVSARSTPHVWSAALRPSKLAVREWLRQRRDLLEAPVRLAALLHLRCALIRLQYV
jgi:hypothetical protein